MWSGDATTTVDELADAVSDTGIDVICVTDHGTVRGALEIENLAVAGRFPCRVVVAEEVRTSQGELIGLFLSERLPPRQAAGEIARAVRSQGGLVYVPHPFDPLRHCLARSRIDELVDAGLVDGFEAVNAKTSLAHLNEQAAGFGRAHDLFLGAGSDAHVPAAVGAAYVEMPDFSGAAGFARSARCGRIVGHHSDPARPWAARIVPSLGGTAAPSSRARASGTGAGAVAGTDAPKPRPGEQGGPPHSR